MKKIFTTILCITTGVLIYGQVYNFTTAGASGSSGPIQAQIDAAYVSTTLAGSVTINTQGIQEWTVPLSGTYHILATGASGGEVQGSYYPGLPGTGATIEGDFLLTSGTVVKVVVGQKGIYANNGSSGGGGSFVFTGSPGGGGLMIAAGGGGGHGHGSAGYPSGAHGGGGSATTTTVSGTGTGDGGSPGIGQGGNGGGIYCGYGAGSGGAGWLSNGGTSQCDGNSNGGNYLTFQGGYSTQLSVGGFGGAGGTWGNGTGGSGAGGYTGGGGGNGFNGSTWGGGAGAGSFNGGTNQVNTAGVTAATSGYADGTVTIMFLGMPETNVKGNNQNIADGDAIPSFSDHTIFDATSVCNGTSTRTYTIQNLGDGTLNISTIVLSGTNAGDFSVTSPPASSVAPADSTMFTVTFNPSGLGVRTATLTINNTDSDEATYDFGISGTGAVDIVAPIADLPSLPDLEGICAVTVSVFPTATDDCEGAITGTTTDSLNYSSGGSYIITWTYEDSNGNSSTQTQNVIIEDLYDPIPDINDLPTINGGCTTVITIIPTATDNCAGLVTATTTDDLTYNTGGTYIIDWIYEDGNGNIAWQTQTVIVPDCSGIENPLSKLVTLFPNPNNGVFNILLDITIESDIQLSLTNNLGQVLDSRLIQSNNQLFDYSYLPLGTYFLQLKSGAGYFTEKIIITGK